MPPVFRFCIHRTLDSGEVAILLEDANATLRAEIERHWREAGTRRRMREPLAIVNEAIEEWTAGLDDVARTRTVRL